MHTSLTPAVDLVEGRPMVSSLRVAEHFAKHHHHVIRDIRRVASEVSREFAETNFGFCDYTAANNKKFPMCFLTRDGFTIVAMGYTGSDAMRLKEAYIRRFNEMERALIEGRHGQPVAIAPTLATKAERKPLVDLVRMWVSMAPLGYGPAFRQVNTAMGVASVEDMTVETVQRAIAWVQQRIDAIQNAPKALPPAEPDLPADLRRRLSVHAHECLAFASEVHMRSLELGVSGWRLAQLLYPYLSERFTDQLARERVLDSISANRGTAAIDMGADALCHTARLMEGLAGMK